jgi:competence protein ComEC
MVLGLDDRLSQPTREAFKLSGLTHILAVSGQNVTLLAAFVLALSALLGLPLRSRLAAALLIILLYIPLTGSAASIQRAGIMGGMGIIATLVGRPSSRWYALGLAAAGTLILNPNAVDDPGWQLSFAAVVGLYLLHNPLCEALCRRRLPRPLAEATAMTTAATIATAPLLVMIFGQVSIASLPANVAAAPAIAPVMWLGMVSATLGQIGPALAEPVNILNSGFLMYINWVAHTSAKLPGAAIQIETFSLLGAFLFALVTVSTILILRNGQGKRLPWRRIGGLLAHRVSFPLVTGLGVSLIAAIALAWPKVFHRESPRVALPGELVVSFLNIGQGDATLLQRNGAAVLVDTGPPDGQVIRRLEDAGVRRLDALMLTHPEADHEGAALDVIERFKPRLIVNNGGGRPTYVQHRLPAAERRVGAREVTAQAGQSLKIGEIKFQILWPPPGLPKISSKSDPNKRAIVSVAQVGSFKIFLPADATSEITSGLVNQPVDVMKVAHHGSADMGLPSLLQRLKPKAAAIMVGRHNGYGHPKPRTLQALKASTPNVFRTDKDGTVRLIVRNGELRVERLGEGR